MTGTIRNKPTRRTCEKGWMGRRAARTRVRASTYRDSARKRRDYQHERRERRAAVQVEDRLLYQNLFDVLNDQMINEYYKWLNELNLSFKTTPDNQFEPSKSSYLNCDIEHSDVRKEEQRLIDLACTIGCNI